MSRSPASKDAGCPGQREAAPERFYLPSPVLPCFLFLLFLRAFPDRFFNREFRERIPSRLVTDARAPYTPPRYCLPQHRPEKNNGRAKEKNASVERTKKKKDRTRSLRKSYTEAANEKCTRRRARAIIPGEHTGRGVKESSAAGRKTDDPRAKPPTRCPTASVREGAARPQAEPKKNAGLCSHLPLLCILRSTWLISSRFFLPRRCVPSLALATFSARLSLPTLSSSIRRFS